MSEATYYPTVQHGMSRKPCIFDTESSKQNGDQRVSSTNRRRLLCGLAGSVGLLAGCSDLTGGNSTETQQPATTESTTDDSTPTATPTATADETTTQQTTTASGPELTTYRNERYGYSIQYPTEWSVDERIKQVHFTSDSENSQLLVEIIDELGQNTTLPQIVDSVITNTKDEFDDVEVLGERDVTHSSGQPAHIIEFRYTTNDTGETMRNTYLVTLHEERAYEVEFGYRNANYTEAAEQLATSIIDSFALADQDSADDSTDQNTDEPTNEALDLSSLTTYTNDGIGYRIKYPEHWTIDDSSQSTVGITNSDSGVIGITEFDGSRGSDTPTELADHAIEEEFESVLIESPSRQETTIPSGQPAVMLDATYDLSDYEGGPLRTVALFTSKQDTGYRVHFIAEASIWTSSVERGVERIITSFELTN